MIYIGVNSIQLYIYKCYKVQMYIQIFNWLFAINIYLYKMKVSETWLAMSVDFLLRPGKHRLSFVIIIVWLVLVVWLVISYSCHCVMSDSCHCMINDSCHCVINETTIITYYHTRGSIGKGKRAIYYVYMQYIHFFSQLKHFNIISKVSSLIYK